MCSIIASLLVTVSVIAGVVNVTVVRLPYECWPTHSFSKALSAAVRHSYTTVLQQISRYVNKCFNWSSTGCIRMDVGGAPKRSMIAVLV